MTLRHQLARAKEFWGGVADHDGLRKTDPRMVLFEYLASYKQREVSEAEACRKVALAWRHFFAPQIMEKELTRLVIRNPVAPIFIAGSIYDGTGVYEYDYFEVLK